MFTCSLEIDGMKIDIPNLQGCNFYLVHLICSNAITKPTQLSVKYDLATYNCDSNHIFRKMKHLFPLLAECVCLLPFSFSFRCLKNFHQLWLVKIFSQAVSVLSRACQTAGFDWGCNTWEHLQYVDLCFSWDCHFITSFSRHIHSGLFFSPRQSKSGPGPSSHTMEQCYKENPNHPGCFKWFDFALDRHDQVLRL